MTVAPIPPGPRRTPATDMILAVHAGGEATPRRPVILVLHGWRGTAADVERRTKGTFDRLADREGAVVVTRRRWAIRYEALDPSPPGEDLLEMKSAEIVVDLPD